MTARRPATSERILLVDESRDLVATLGELLTDLGHVVMSAHDGAIALRLLRSFEATTIILDLRLPGMLDGFALARQVRATLPAQPRLIALTASGAAASKQRAADAGIDAYLVKPVGIQTLVAELERPRPRTGIAIASPADARRPGSAVRRRRIDRAEQYLAAGYRGLQARLAANLRRMRIERGWTQEDAARRCTMSPRLLQRLEAGNLNATMTTLGRLCDGFGVDIDALFTTTASGVAAPRPARGRGRPGVGLV